MAAAIDKPEIHAANFRAVETLLNFLLTGGGYTGYFIGRAERGKIRMIEYRHTHPVDERGRHEPPLAPSDLNL